MSEFKDLALEIANLLEEKNKNYGSSFDESGKILKILFPNGCPPEKYDDMLAIARIVDKLFRIATNKSAFAEEPYFDLAGYGLLGTRRERARKNQAENFSEETIAKVKNLEEHYARLAVDATEEPCPCGNKGCPEDTCCHKFKKFSFMEDGLP